MITEVVAVIALAVGGQDIVHADVTGSRRWRVALEGPRGVVAFIPIAEEGDTREVVLITTARMGETGALTQRYFVHTLDCPARTQAQTGFGLTDPPPRRWTARDGPPMSRPVVVPSPIEPNTAMATIAQVVCGDATPALPEIEGDWSAVATALRQRVEASSRSLDAAGDR